MLQAAPIIRGFSLEPGKTSGSHPDILPGPRRSLLGGVDNEWAGEAANFHRELGGGACKRLQLSPEH